MDKEKAKHIPAKLIRTAVAGAAIVSLVTISDSAPSNYITHSMPDATHHRVYDPAIQEAQLPKVVFASTKAELPSSNRFDPDELSTGSRIALSLALVGFTLASIAKASEFSHHAEKHEKRIAWTGVTITALANLALIADSWK